MAKSGWATRFGVVALTLSSYPAFGHDQWANNEPVPAWVKSSCCGPRDVHKLDPTKVWEVYGGWRIEGLNRIVPKERTFPSQDGSVWAFYDEFSGREAIVHCLFVAIGY